MKNVRFYVECGSPQAKKQNKNIGNVVAVFPKKGRFQRGGELCVQAIHALHDYADSPAESGSLALDYLRKRCKRVSEDIARVIHPRLFEALNA